MIDRRAPILALRWTPRRSGRARAVWLVGVVATSFFLAGWCGELPAETGTVYSLKGAGLNLDVDTRWVDSAGYRPVRITVTPAMTVVADRTLTVEFRLERQWPNRRRYLCVVQDVELPAGTGPVETTLSIPQMIAWDTYSFAVMENGKAIRSLGASGSSNRNIGQVWEDYFPAVLVVGDSLPDTTPLGNVLVPEHYRDMNPMLGRPQTTGSSTGKGQPLPSVTWRPVGELPERWIDYSGLDVVCIGLAQLDDLRSQQREALAAIVDWTTSGGNLFVCGVGEDWVGLPQLESLLALPPEPVDPDSDSRLAGWSEPKADLFGKKVRGVGSDVQEPPEIAQRPDKAPFLLRPLEMGMVVVMAAEDPFAESPAYWAWAFNAVGSKRFLWSRRHGMSGARPNPEFLKFLIEGVGLAPVNGFRVLITLFVLAIGPLNYFLLRRSKRLYLLVITIPAGAGAVTAALFGYAVVADGLGTRVRVRSVTRIDQRNDRAVCWSRLSYYAGLAPGRGLTFPDDVAVLALDRSPGESQSGRRELFWREDQWLASGWLRSRTPAQFMTVRSRSISADVGLRVADSEESPDGLTVENGLGTEIYQLLIRANDGAYYWAADVKPDAAVSAQPEEELEGLARLQETLRSREPKYPPGADETTSGFSTMGSRMWMYNQSDLPEPEAGTSRLEDALAFSKRPSGAAAGAIEPGSYVAVVKKSPEVELGTPAAREESSLHVILGRW